MFNFNVFENIDFPTAFGVSYSIHKYSMYLLQFLLSLTNVNLETASQTTLFSLLCTLKNIYYLRHRNVVLPLNFAISLIVYSLTRSKLSLQAINKTGPCGSYSTIQTWLTNTSENVKLNGENKVSILHDVQKFIDNCQVIGRTWNVHLNNKVKASVITNIIHITPSQLANPPIQSLPDLSPSRWQFPRMAAGDAEQLFLDFIRSADEEFRYVSQTQL